MAFACGGGEHQAGPAYIVVEGDTLRLLPGAQVVEVSVLTVRTPEIEPSWIRVRPGDVVRIVGADGGPHALAFDLTATDSASRVFLEQTGQLRGPPLLSPGATWILRFDEASGSGYVIRCLTHGATLQVSVESQLATPRRRQ